MSRRALLAFTLSACAFAPVCACGDDGNGGPDSDAATERDAAVSIADATPLPDRIDPLLWVEFSATGCASGGLDDTPCTGPAPLAVRFTATAPAAIDTYVWAFGDGTPNNPADSPIHVFERPGVYDVMLTVGGPGGTATASRAGFVIAVPAALGAVCDLDLQCAAGLECVCGDDVACPAGLDEGVCTATCSDSVSCPGAAVCADLAPSDPPADGDWNRVLCLPACEDDGQCRAGMRCRELRSGAGDTWVRGCFAPELLLDVGRSCAASDGSPDGSACASGVCAPEGARGMCTADCTVDACPSDAACATFGGGLGSLCLARCSDDFACDGDPWLACEAPGGAGAKGFTVTETPAAAGYCAPRSCSDPMECGPDGTCTAGYCAAP